MIAFVVLLLVAGVMSQRSPYLGSAKDYPGVLPRFGTSNNSGGSVDDRLGAPPAPSQQGGADGTLYDKETVDRVATWPKDKQPFWYVNRGQIADHRGYRPTQQAGPNAQNV